MEDSSLMNSMAAATGEEPAQAAPAFDEVLKNKNLSGDPAAGSVEVKRFAKTAVRLKSVTISATKVIPLPERIYRMLH